MITTFLLTILFNFLNFLLSLLPVGVLPTAIATAVGYFWGVLNSFSFVFPVGALLGALLLVLSFDIAMLLWHIIQWVIRKIPFMQ